ncbi:MAG TPA: VOC family protein [Tepidisphaeraceae bacterium]|nr:VOC family protein [Tepidisphaeraceae bacterium]
METVAIDHPSIACHDVKRQAEWYCSTFGMRVVASNDAEPAAMVIGFGPSLCDGAMIELMPATEPGPEPHTLTRFQPGIRHVAFRVRDFEAAYAKLKRLGVRFVTEPGEALGGGKTVLFRDPEGNELQIVQR